MEKKSRQRITPQPPLVCLFRCDPNHPYKCSFFSRNVEHVLGFSADHFLRDGQFWHSRLHPESAVELESIQAKLDSLHRISWNYRWLDAGRRHRTVHLEILQVRDAQGLVTELLGCLTWLGEGIDTDVAKKAVSAELDGFLDQVIALRARSNVDDLLLQRMSDEFPEPVILAAFDGQILYRNEALIALFGSKVRLCDTLEECARLCRMEGCTEKQNPFRPSKGLRALASGETETMVVRLRSLSAANEVRELQWRARCFGGQILISIKDITGILEALRESTHSAGNVENFAFFVSDPTYPYRLQAFGDTVHKACGFPAEYFETDNSAFYERLHEGDQTALTDSIARLDATGQASLSYRWKHADGHFRRLHSDSRTMKDRKGRPVELLGCLVDIDAIGGVEQAAQFCRERVDTYLAARARSLVLEREDILQDSKLTRLLVERGAVPMAIVRVDRRVEYVNQAFTRAFGYAPEPNATSPDWAELLIRDEGDRADAELFWKGTVLTAARVDAIIAPWVGLIPSTTGDPILYQVRFTSVSDYVALVFDDITAIRELVDSLEESEQRFQTLFNSQLDAILVVDAEGRIVEVNQAAEEVFGISRQELLQMRHTDIQSTLAIELRAEARERAISGEHVRLQGSYKGKGGIEVPIEYHIAPVRYNGQMMALGVARDVSDRLLAERTLLENQARLGAITRHTRSSLIELDIEGRVLFANRSFLGRHPEDVIGKKVHALGWPAPLLEAFQECLAKMAPVAIEHSGAIANDGAEVLHSEFVPVFVKARINQIVLTSTDITERRAQDRALALRLDALTGTTDGVLILHVPAEGQSYPIVFADPAFESLTGHRADEVMGSTARELLFGDETDASTMEAIETSMLSGTNFSGEIRLKRKSNDHFWADLRIIASRSEQGQLTHFIWLLLDISTHKRANSELELHRQELQRLGVVSAVGEVSIAFAHELAQPLSAITGNATAVLNAARNNPQVSPETLEPLQDIVEDVRRLREVFDRIRSIGQRRQHQHERVNLNALVKEVIHLTQPQSSASQIKMRAKLTEDLPHIDADPVQLQQVLLNLLANAFDAVESCLPSHRVVEVGTARHGDKHVEITVVDSGSGIDPNNLPRIFEKFFTTKTKGTGIGLGLCRTMVEAHGGKLTGENNRTGGARFCVTLPIHEFTSSEPNAKPV